MLKLDLATAFDRIEWNFIEAVLRRQGYHPHLITPVHCFIATPYYSVLVNGDPTQPFHPQRGIRHGFHLFESTSLVSVN